MSKSNTELSNYEAKIFEQWLEIYKRSATTKLLLRAVSDKPRYSKEIHDYLNDKIDNKWSINEKSMHRTLRRLSDLDLIDYKQAKSAKTGLKRKVYSITPSGARVLREISSITGPL